MNKQAFFIYCEDNIYLLLIFYQFITTAKKKINYKQLYFAKTTSASKNVFQSKI